MPHAGPGANQLTIAGSIWELANQQGRAQNAAVFSQPLTQNAVVCSYNQHLQCCSYTATIGGMGMNREFEFVRRAN